MGWLPAIDKSFPAIPADGYPETQAGVRALRQAKVILNRIVDRRDPAKATPPQPRINP
jgi:hypothetical protein